MIALMAQSGHTTYNFKEFIIDKEADLDNLPVDIPMGSYAFCIDNSEVYMLNGSREWVKI